jgi:hypothetical protein
MQPTPSDNSGPSSAELLVPPPPSTLATPTPTAGLATADAAGPVPYGYHRHTQWVLLGAAASAFALFWWVAEVLGIPAHPGYRGSLLKQPVGGALLAVVVAAVLVLGTAAVVTRLARRHWAYAGVLAASAGLAAWAFRGGPVGYVLIAPDAVNLNTGVFFGLAVEMLVLGVVVGAAWLVVLPRFAGPLLAGGSDAPTPLVPVPTGATSSGVTSSGMSPLVPRPDAAVLTAVLAQALLVGVGVALLVPNAEKKQAAFGVLAACFLATAIAQHYFHDEKVARWYWAGPILVGVLGYLLNAFGAGAREAVETGRLVGSFAALARPIPLDYAGAGVAGALMGYWIGSDHPDATVVSSTTADSALAPVTPPSAQV